MKVFSKCALEMLATQRESSIARHTSPGSFVTSDRAAHYGAAILGGDWELKMYLCQVHKGFQKVGIKKNPIKYVTDIFVLIISF